MPDINNVMRPLITSSGSRSSPIHRVNDASTSHRILVGICAARPAPVTPPSPYACRVFGRPKSATAQDAPTIPTAKEGGKGRPTPRRRDAEQRNRRPLVGPPVPAGATKAERKKARAAQREQLRSERALGRQALMTGDERHLPARDKGPAKRFARDYVDSRRNAGEYFLMVALLAVMTSLIRNPLATLVSMLVLYGTVLIVAVDSFVLRRRVQRLAAEKFGADAAGVGTYAMMRALQFRRGRLPRPQVQRRPLFRR